MSKSLYFLPLCLFYCACGLFVKAPPPALSDHDTYFKDTCYYENKVSLVKRMQESHFKAAKRIEIVSFYNDIAHKGLEKDTIDHYNTFIERFTLSKNDIDTLSQITHFSLSQMQIKPLPKGYKHPPLLLYSYACYFVPRHALLFYNTNDKVYLRWDICFECQQNKINSTNDTVRVKPLMCSEQYEALRLLFKRIGIKQFINPERPE